MPQSHVEIASKCRKRISMFSFTNPFHLLVLAVQLGKEIERTAWYRAEEIKKTVQKTERQEGENKLWTEANRRTANWWKNAVRVK